MVDRDQLSVNARAVFPYLVTALRVYQLTSLQESVPRLLSQFDKNIGNVDLATIKVENFLAVLMNIDKKAMDLNTLTESGDDLLVSIRRSIFLAHFINLILKFQLEIDLYVQNSNKKINVFILNFALGGFAIH